MNILPPNVFTPFLESLAFVPDNPNTIPIAAVAPPRLSVKASGQEYTEPPILLYQRERSELTIQGFQRKLLSVLRNACHIANEAIVNAILGCTVGAAKTGNERLVFLEDILNRFHKADVSHFFILPHASVAETIRFEGYTMGATEMDVLGSRCRRADSNYAELYGREHAGHLCLMSPNFHHVVIDFLRPMIDYKLVGNNSCRNLLLNYFTLVSHQHFEYMWAHLDRTQVLSRPFNASVLQVNDLRNDLGRFADRITIYLGFSRFDAGYVVPQKGANTCYQSTGSEGQVLSRYLTHRSAYRLNEVGDSELGRTAYACAGFCQQAMQFLEAGRSDDAALYATICLEHLFSEKKSTMDAVCSRTAVVTHLRMGASFSEAEKELRGLYDARSGFVHSGKSVTPANAERLSAYARETLRSLLALHLKPENRNSGFLEKWIKDLDFIVSGFVANRTFDDSLLMANGIFKS